MYLRLSYMAYLFRNQTISKLHYKFALAVWLNDWKIRGVGGLKDPEFSYLGTITIFR